MSHKQQSPAMHIARRHQSSPKAHPAEVEIRKAAVEIDEGRYVEDVRSGDDRVLDGLGLALGFGTDGVAVGAPQSFKDWHKEEQATRQMNELGRHPRVQAAMESMREEIDQAKTPEEEIEMRWRLHEMLAAEQDRHKWAGQERWEGKENEEMRQGQVLSPWQFFEKLCKVIGPDRVILKDDRIIKLSANAKSGLLALVVRNPLWNGQTAIQHDYAQVKASELRQAAEAELVKGKKLRKAKVNAEADKSFHLAGDMIQTASEMLLEREAYEAEVPQYLRVGTLQAPLGTEWMQMNFDEFGVPTSAKFVGWRTALLTMIRSRAITEEEAHKAFPVSSGPAADWYQQQLYMRRNADMAGFDIVTEKSNGELVN
jgi:hypothetical protein